MKTAGVTLHLCQKIAVTCTIAFVAIFLLLTTIVSISITADLVQLNSLLQSDYVYSATTSSVTADDAYYQYQAGITFSPAEDAKGGINAEVVMQTADSHYTDLVYWNTHRLEQDGVAISANIANENCLEVGDTMFSKNIIVNIPIVIKCHLKLCPCISLWYRRHFSKSNDVRICFTVFSK